MADNVRKEVAEAPPAPANWHSFEVGATKITREPYLVDDPSGATEPNLVDYYDPETDQYKYYNPDDEADVSWYDKDAQPEGWLMKQRDLGTKPVQIETHGYVNSITITEEDADGNPIDRSNPLYPAFQPFTHNEIKDLPEYEAYKLAGYALAAAAYAKRKADAGE